MPPFWRACSGFWACTLRRLWASRLGRVRWNVTLALVPALALALVQEMGQRLAEEVGGPRLMPPKATAAASAAAAVRKGRAHRCL